MDRAPKKKLSPHLIAVIAAGGLGVLVLVFAMFGGGGEKDVQGGGGSVSFGREKASSALKRGMKRRRVRPTRRSGRSSSLQFVTDKDGRSRRPAAKRAPAAYKSPLAGGRGFSDFSMPKTKHSPPAVSKSKKPSKKRKAAPRRKLQSMDGDFSKGIGGSTDLKSFANPKFRKQSSKKKSPKKKKKRPRVTREEILKAADNPSDLRKLTEKWKAGAK